MTDRLAEIRERWAKAVGGPWERVPFDPLQIKTVYGAPYMDESGLLPVRCAPGLLSDANAEAIAAAPADVAYLLEVADAAQAVVEAEPIDEEWATCIYCGHGAGYPFRHAPDCPWMRLRGLVEPGADPGADKPHQVQLSAPPRNP